MIPSSTWSTVTVFADYDLPVLPLSPKPVNDATPYTEALGPGEISGRLDQAWHAAYWQDGSVKLIKMGSSSWGNPVTLFSEPTKPESLALTFDQLGRAIVFYSIAPDQLKLYFYDPTQSASVITAIATGKNPIAGFDIPNNTSDPNSDALLFYVRNDRVYSRLQRDRFLVEYDTGLTKLQIKLYGCGRRKDRRFQLSYKYRAPA